MKRTASGIQLLDVYSARPSAGDASAPGEYPYTRGRPRVAREWIQRELSGEGSPSTSNTQFRYLIEHGATGLDVIGDTPTTALLDPDHPMAKASVGAAGVSLCRMADFVELYDGVPLDAVSVSHSMPGAFAAAGLWLAAERFGFAPERLRGSLLQTPLYTEDCSYATHLPIDLRMRLSRDSMAFCARSMPRFYSFIEDTYYISDGGVDAVTKMALGFVEIRALVRMMLASGHDIDSFGPRIGILVNCRMDLFEEIAKVRATRRIFARMMREEFGARDPRSWQAPVTVHTSGLTLTAQQPVNNIVRGALQALAMAMAGVDALEVSAFDEAFRTPSRAAHLVALRTQQILSTETNVGAVRDPLGGSYYVEELTDAIEERILAHVRAIETDGDPVRLADGRYFRGIIERAAESYGQRVDRGEHRVVGLNVHEMDPADDTLLRDVAEERFQPATEHAESVAAWRPTRAESPLRAALRAVRDAARDPDADLMAPLVAALRADATFGEIAGAMRLGSGLPADPFGRVEVSL